MRKWLTIILLLLTSAGIACAQSSFPPTIYQNQGSNLGVASKFNCSTGTTCTLAGGTVAITSSGGGAVAPNQNVVYASPNCGSQPNCSFVNADAHFVADASTTSTGTTITCPNSDCDFTGTDVIGRPIAKVGQIVFATSVGGGYPNTMGTVICPQSTILSINNANSITVSSGGACTANTTATAWLFWGDDDSTNLATFWTLVGCSRGVLPAGYMFVQQGEFMSAPSANCSALSNSVYQSPTLQGQGLTATWIIPTPNFSASTCVGTGGVGNGSNACFGSLSPTDWRDFSIWGGGNPRTNSGTSHAVFSMGAATRAYNVDVEFWATAETGWTCVIMNGNQDIFQLGGGFACGQKGLYVPSTVTVAGEAIGNFWTGVSNAAVDIAGVFYELDDGVLATGSGAVAAHYVESTGNDSAYNETCLSETSVSCSRVDGTLHIHDSWFGTGFAGGSAPASTYAIYTENAGAVVTAQNTVFTGGSGGGWMDFTVAGAKFFDQGGNTYSGSLAGSADGTIFAEANSANTTVLTSAKLVLSSGWGSTAAWSSLYGGDFPIQGTITNSGTGQGASPTITYTFPTALQVAPFSCSMIQTGGTNSTGTFTISSISATGFTATFSLTPTASDTEIVYANCVTP